MLTNDDIEELIKHITHQHSGGVKFTELIVWLVQKEWEHGKIMSLPEQIEKLKPAGLQVLKYTYNLSDKLGREKIFIYTP